MLLQRFLLLIVLAHSAFAAAARTKTSLHKNNRKVLATATAGSWSISESFPWFQMPSVPPTATAQGAGQATVDQGTAGANTQSTTTTPEYYLDCICASPNADTTAEALSQAFAAGVNSAESRAASQAVAQAGDKCCVNLGRALARAAAFAESQGQGNAFVTAASRSQAEATNLCGMQAIAQAISGSRASNGNSEATSSAEGSASGPGAIVETQTEATVGGGMSSSSSSSWAVSG
jgi:hypothetical protein